MLRALDPLVVRCEGSYRTRSSVRYSALDLGVARARNQAHCDLIELGRRLRPYMDSRAICSVACAPGASSWDPALARALRAAAN